MNITSNVATALLVLSLAGCGKPVPPEKEDYVGEWRGKSMYLLITQDGTVSYKRVKGGGTVTVNGPLKGFNGSDFEVGVGPMSTIFVVTKEPYQMAGQWKLVVDGVELIKTAE